MLSISDEHKEAIIRLINGIVSDNPVITNLTDRSKVSHKLVKLIHYFEHSVDSGNKSLLLLRCLSFEALIENWLLHYYIEDSVMDSFAIEEGVEQELSTASLLILYVIFKFSVCFPHIVMYFNDNWIQLQEFNTKLDQMLKNNKIMKLLSKQLDTNVNTNVNKSIANHTKSKTNEDLSRLDNNSVIPEVSTNSGLNTSLSMNSKTTSNHSSNEELIIPQMLSADQSAYTSVQTVQNFECGFCNRLFGSKYKLKRHEFVHKPMSKPYACPWNSCELRFRSSFDMRRHFVTHTGERPFVCDICTKRFSRADKLKDHKLIHKRSEDKQKSFNINENNTQNNSQTLENNRNEDISGFDFSLFANQLMPTFKTEFNV